jgi:hypothetical protein
MDRRGHGLEHRKGSAADLHRHPCGERSGARAGLGKAHAVDDGRGGRGARAFLGGADAISSSNTFPSLPLIDPETLEFEVNVDGLISLGGLGGPAILPLSLAKMVQ